MDIIIDFKLFRISRTISISRQWIRFGIIALVILMSTLIPFWGSWRILLLLLVLLIGLGVILVLLRQPNLGFILIMMGGMFVPFTGPSGLNAATLVVAMMLGLWILDMFVVQRNFQFVQSPSMIPIITFLVISILAFLVGQIPWFVFARQAPITAQVGGVAIFIFSIGGTLLAANLIKDLRWLKIVVWAFIGLCAPYMLSYIPPLSFLGHAYQRGFVTESMFWTWLIAMAFSQLLYNRDLTPRVKVALVVLIVLTFFDAIYYGYEWKSGWVPALVSVAVLLGIRYKKLVMFGIPFMIVGIMYVAAKLVLSEGYSWGTRVDAWRIVLEISRISPVLGMGFANYYWYTPLFPIRGWRVTFNSHSQFVDLIAQTGYLGLLCFLWIFFEIGRSSWNIAKQLPDGFPRAYAYGVLAGLIATLLAAFLGDWVLPFVYNVGLTGFRASILPWIFMGGLISLEQMLAHNQLKRRNTISG